MQDSNAPWYPWSIFSALLWLVFVTMGLFPEVVVIEMRSAAQLLPRREQIEGAYLITLAMSVYVVWYTSQRCADAGLDGPAVRARTLQAGLWALVAFLPVHLENVAGYLEIEPPTSRYVVMAVASIKLAAWAAMALVLLGDASGALANPISRMPSIFPSTYGDTNETASAEAGSSGEVEPSSSGVEL